MASIAICALVLLLSAASSYGYPLINPGSYYYYMPGYPNLQAYQTAVPTATLTTIGTAPTTPILGATPPGTAATIPGFDLTRLTELIQNFLRPPGPAPAPAPSPAPAPAPGEGLYLQQPLGPAPMQPHYQSNPGYYTWGYVIPSTISGQQTQPQTLPQLQPQQHETIKA